jgi:hypothetical protein
VSAVDTGKFWAEMGIGGPGAGPAEIGRALRLGPNRRDKISFYLPKLLFNAKTIPVKTRKCF